MLFQILGWLRKEKYHSILQFWERKNGRDMEEIYTNNAKFRRVFPPTRYIGLKRCCWYGGDGSIVVKVMQCGGGWVNCIRAGQKMIFINFLLDLFFYFFLNILG